MSSAANPTTAVDETPVAETTAPAPVTAQKAGFLAADDEVATQSDILDTQAAIDRKNAENAEQAAQTEETAPTPAIPALIVPVASAAANDDQDAKTAHEKCLKALAAFYGQNNLLHTEYLSGMAVLTATALGLHLQGTENKFLVGKRFVEADTFDISPRDALEMAVLAVNNPTLKAAGVTLTGGAKERYLLTLAARKFDLKITNAFEESEIPEADKAEFESLKTEWLATISTGTAPAAPAVAAATPEAAPVAEEPVVADVEARIEPTLGEMPVITVKTAVDQTPAETAQVEKGQDRLKDLLSQAATPAPAASDAAETPAPETKIATAAPVIQPPQP